MPKLLENGNLRWDAYEYDAMTEDELNILGHMNEDAQKQFVGMRLDEIKLFLRNRKAVMDSYSNEPANSTSSSESSEETDYEKERKAYLAEYRRKRIASIFEKVTSLFGGIIFPFMMLIGCITQLQKLFLWL